MIIPSEVQNSLTQAFKMTESGNNQLIHQGTQLLLTLRQDVLYPKVLLDFFSSNVELKEALRAAIEFKIWFQTYKDYADYEYNVVQQSVEVVKQQIVTVYLQSQKQVAAMVQDAIISIAKRDFPLNWQNLLLQLAPVLDYSNYSLDMIQKVLKLFRKLFVKYEYSSRSDPLYIEIIYVCDTLHNPLLKLIHFVLTNITNQQGELPIQYKILKSLLRVFYFLNYQDIHPLFEENLQTWMKIMQTVLQLQATAFPKETFNCKGEALRSVLLYATKYREDFEGLIQLFSQEIWQVCTSVNEDQSYDKVVIEIQSPQKKIVHNALKYFKSLVAWSDMKPFFSSNMVSLMENLVLRNMAISSSDTFNFQDDPQAFLESYFENSDLENRRAQTVELYKSLTRYYKDIVTQILQGYITQYITTFNTNNQGDMQTEVLLINILIDGLVTAYTSKDGAIDIQVDIQLPLTFYDQVLKKRLTQLFQLSSQALPIDQQFPPIVLAFYCRFLFVYRNFIPQNEILSITQVVSKLTLSKQVTLCKIACYTVEALLTIKKGDLKSYANLTPLFTKENVFDAMNPILQDIYTYSKNQRTLEQFGLRCVGVILALMKENSLTFVDPLSEMFSDQLELLNNGGFDFQNALLVFESMGTFLQSALIANSQQTAITFCNRLLTTLDQMLRENKGDICTFILQIYSLLVRIIDTSNKQHNDYFQAIFNSFLTIDNWQDNNQALFPAYILFFEGWLKKRDITQADVLAIQNILQQIIQFTASNFNLLADLVMSLQQGVGWIPFVLSQVFKQYSVNLQLLQNPQENIYSKSKQGSLQQRVINKEAFITLSNISMKFGVIQLLEECNTIQAGLLENFLVNEIIIVKSIQNRLERRQIFIMLTQLLFESQFKLSQPCWQVLFQSIVENFTLRRKAALRMLFKENIPPNSITSSSGFQKLQALQQIKEKQQPLVDEEKYFGQRFKQFYSDPYVQQQLNIPSLINTQQQEMLTQIIQNA